MNRWITKRDVKEDSIEAPNLGYLGAGVKEKIKAMAH